MLKPILFSLLSWFLALRVLAVPYSEYILAPENRTLKPRAVYGTNGTVTNAAGITENSTGSTTLNGPSYITYDYGRNIAGVVSVEIESVSESASLSLTYAESSYFISASSSDSLRDGAQATPLTLDIPTAGSYSVSRYHEFGAFRYLTVVNPTAAEIVIISVTTNFTAVPINEPTAYTGYFHSENELLNRIWYAGAYTAQLCTIDPAYGDAFDGWYLPDGLIDWSLNATLTEGRSCLVDGGKRDRVVWSGDMVVTIPTVGVSTNDMYSMRNSIDSLLSVQKSNGQLPYFGWTYSSKTHSYISSTYHLHTIVDLLYYVQWSADTDYLTTVWSRVVAALQWSLSSVDDTGLMSVGCGSDWGRPKISGYNTEANAILYHTLLLSSQAANILNDTASASNWTAAAEKLKTAANSLLWDASVGLYMDQENSTLYPQDGNSWAIKANLTDSSARAQSISAALSSRWTEYGAPAPELPGIISPFISGIEAEAHFLSDNASRALDLISLQWGFMLDNEYMTNSTFVEGYTTSGTLEYGYKTYSRISHAHGWSTAPTNLLTSYVAGLKIESLAGETWKIAPHPGGLSNIEAGVSTALGNFTIIIAADGDIIGGIDFCTPANTTGSLELPGQTGSIWKDGTRHYSYTNTSGPLEGGCYYFRHF
ncbi:hypothetical protein PFICI_08884 [Pestalotiopsis fici W106-1]|uniref:Alpha-L-rhamnosidase six-hairpin glycosidase domain-containing protein n=1 Tax=Pestalotiopsis fici (strain W106-1 / CGMCC3.15140) TaxID=1229662 RepID=W3X1I2_PESFW|nr:uncharacterized protein PFICI_08884 [Pestalotiopsis fici W106-1]ETS79031.1 hypothetical protein PFICI_08884 [Pestalotiopsis fici W106-1]